MQWNDISSETDNNNDNSYNDNDDRCQALFFKKKLLLSQKQRNWRTPLPFFSIRIVVFRPRLESSYFSVDFRLKYSYSYSYSLDFREKCASLFHLTTFFLCFPDLPLAKICSEHNLSLGYTFNTFLIWAISAPILLPSKVYSYTSKTKVYSGY